MGLNMESAPVAARPGNGTTSAVPGLKIGKVIGGLFKRLLPDGDE